MFLLLNSSGERIGVVETPLYIKINENGTYISAKPLEAQGISFRNIPYHIKGKPLMHGDEEDVRLVRTDLGKYFDQNNSSLYGYLFDCEYRLAMLELQVETYDMKKEAKDDPV